MLEKLTPSSNYSVSVTMRNAEGEGPAAMTIVATPTKPEGFFFIVFSLNIIFNLI